MSARRIPALLRRGGRSPVGGGAVVPPPVPPGAPLIWLREDGITAASGVVAAWDSEGSNTQRFSAPTVPARPDVVADGAAFDRLIPHLLYSDANVALTKPYSFCMVVSVQEFTASLRYIWRGDSRAYIAAIIDGGVDKIRWSDNLVSLDSGDLDINTPISIAGRCGNGGSVESNFWVNGVSVATATPAARTISPAIWAFGATNAAASPQSFTMYDALFYNTRLDDADFASLVAYGEWKRGQV